MRRSLGFLKHRVNSLDGIVVNGGEPTKPPVLSPARGPPAWEKCDQTSIFDPLAPAPEPAFEFDQTVTW